MSNVIDELKVVFTAETGGLMTGLAQIGAKLGALEGISGAAGAALVSLAAAFDGALAGISGDAYAAGADAGAAFARGLKSQAGGVKSAAAYLSASAVSALGGHYTGGDAGGGTGAGATGFDPSILSGAAGAAGGGVSRAVTQINVPLNVDGVKLGEACIRAIGRVSDITGRAHIAI